MKVNYYIKGLGEDHDILLNNASYTETYQNEHLYSLLEADMINAYCYIFKGQEVKFGRVFPRTYTFYKGLFGYKLVATSDDNAKKRMTDKKKGYPEDFNIAISYADIPDPRSHKEYCKSCINKGEPIELTVGDKGYVVVTSEYSQKKYNKLNEMFSHHQGLIDELVRDLNITVATNSKNKISLHPTGLSCYRGKHIFFKDIGMEPLPSEMDVLVAFSDFFVNSFPRFHTDNGAGLLVADIFLHRGNGFAFIEIDLYLEAVQKTGLKKW